MIHQNRSGGNIFVGWPQLGHHCFVDSFLLLYDELVFILHLLVQWSSMLLDVLQSLIDGLLPHVVHRLQHVYFLLHPRLLLILGPLLLSVSLLNGAMVRLVLGVEDVLSFLFQLPLPLAVLLVQLFDVLSHLDRLGVVLRPVVVPPLEQTQGQIHIFEPLFHLFDDLGRSFWWRWGWRGQGGVQRHHSPFDPIKHICSLFVEQLVEEVEMLLLVVAQPVHLQILLLVSNHPVVYVLFDDVCFLSQLLLDV